MAGNELSISDLLPAEISQGDKNARQNGNTGATVQGDDPEGLPVPQPSTKKPVRDGNAQKNSKASTSKNVHRVEEQVVENPEFLDDLAINNDDNGNIDAAEGQPMGTGITSRFK